MAKFTNSDLRLKDGQRVTWGTDLDANMFYDGTADQLRVDVTISGVAPTEAYHLTTRQYVDQGLATLSGSMVLDHGGMTGLGDDDHTQYSLADGSRAFTSTVGGVTPTQDSHLATKAYIDTELATLSGGIVQSHDALIGLGDDDHTQYTLADGSRSFSGVVGGITPTLDAHLTTKGYVDSLVQGIDWQQSIDDYHSPSGGLPVGPSVGDRYIADDSGNGWTVDYIYEWDGSQWVETIPNDGTSAWHESDDILYVYNGSAWVRFGSTITHNNLNNLQGGTANEYYHLSSAQYEALTNNNTNVDDASSQHHHDGRYYTETEMDATISGLQTQITSNSDHGALSGLGDDDHTQYTLVDGSRAFTSTVGGVTPTADAHLTTKLFVDTEIATLSGALSSAAITDHGGLTGLGDDDHTQYILVDGSRAFTSTVGGVTPTADAHLTTKLFVDTELSTLSGTLQTAIDNGGIDRHGRAAIANGASTVTVNFVDIGSTNYTVNATMENTADSPPSVYAFIVSGKTSSSFTVTFMGDMDSANYSLNWTVLED